MEFPPEPKARGRDKARSEPIIRNMSQKFTNSMQTALQNAQNEAHRFEHQNLTVEHLLYALVKEQGSEESSLPAILELAGVNLQALKAGLENRLKSFPKVQSQAGQLYPSPEFQKVLAFAETEAKKLKDEYVAPEHLVLALFQSALSHFESAKILREAGLTPAKFSEALKKVRGNSRIQDEDPDSKMFYSVRYAPKALRM